MVFSDRQKQIEITNRCACAVKQPSIPEWFYEGRPIGLWAVKKNPEAVLFPLLYT